MPCAALESAPLQYGSAFADRTFVRDRAARELLRRFSSTSCPDSGLLAEELEQLRQLLSEPAIPAVTLLPFLTSPSTGGVRLLAAQQDRKVLKCLACADSADALLPTAAHGIARELVRTHQLALASQQLLQQISPVLHAFLRPHLPQESVSADVRNLVEQLLKVRRM